jgi:hypothetical protein
MQVSRLTIKAVHPKPVAHYQQRFTRYTGSFLEAPRPRLSPRTNPERPPRLYIHNGERVSRRDKDGLDMDTNHSSWAPFIGLLVVVIFCAAVWILAPKGENQTYVYLSSLHRAYTSTPHGLLKHPTRYHDLARPERISSCAILSPIETQHTRGGGSNALQHPTTGSNCPRSS